MSQRDHAAVPIILVVEDEPLLRLFAAQIVEDAGYEPLEAASAEQAIAILETRADIRVVFTDVDMPGGMDGIRLAALVRNRWPPIKIIVTSGKPLPPLSTLPAETIVFPKPYRQDRVIASLQQMAA